METKKVKLTQVNRYTTNKEGSPLINKNGKPYSSIRIKCEEYGDKLLSGFGNKDNANWNAGDEVEIMVEQKGEYLNFSTPKKEDKLEEILNQLAGLKLGQAIIIDALDGLGAKTPEKIGNTDKDYPDDDLEPAF